MSSGLKTAFYLDIFKCQCNVFSTYCFAVYSDSAVSAQSYI